MTDLIPLKCPSCGANIRVREGSSLIVCGYCGGTNILKDSVPAAAPTVAPASAAAPAIRPQPIRPRAARSLNIQVENDSQHLRITRRWFNPGHIFLAFFALFWDGFLIFWYSIAAGGGAPTMMLIVPLLHVAVGVYLTYSALTGFVNRTVLELTREQLEIWHEPLPWPGEKTIPTARIKQLYCKERIRHTKNGTRYSYMLCAVTQDDEEIRLLSGIRSPESAAFYEQEMESWLRIPDLPVVGEYGK